MKQPAPTFLRLAFACAVLSCPGLSARATGVRLLNGDAYEGKVLLNSNQLMVVTQSGTTRLELNNVLDATFRDDNLAVKPGMLPIGVLLVNGSLISGPFNGISDPIKVGNESVPLASVAWIVFQPVARERIVQPSGGRTGALLLTGDFFPGVIAGFKDDRVAINSDLFGPQRFSIRGRVDISALVLRDVQNAAGGRYEVSIRNGSIYTATTMKIEGDQLVMQDTNFGTVKINKDDIVSIRLASTQYQLLAPQKPDRVDPPPGVDAATALQVPQDKDGIATHNLHVAVNTAVTYSVPKGFSTFAAGVNVPQGAPPGARFTFAVYGDGKFLLTRTSAIGLNDNPQHLSVPVGNLHIITIRIEPASAGIPAAAADWIKPMFLRQ